MEKQVNAFSNDILGTYDAVGIVKLIKQKEVSVTEVLNAAIERAEKVNPALNAIVVKTYEQAKKNLNPKPNSILSGTPTFVKDNTALQGIPTQHGTMAFKAANEKKNGKYATQYLSTGMVSLGKSTLPEFGLLCSAENPAWGITRNPWNTGHTTGGSSSGSAALVAAGVVPIASANDGAGSIRIPAACCGLVGLKPSRGRLVHTDGTELMPINIVCEGVVTRSVRDTAAYFAEAEKYFQNKAMPTMGMVQQSAVKRLRILFFDNIAAGKIGHQDADTSKTIAANMKLLQGLGHKVDVIPYPYNIEDYTEDFLCYYGLMATVLRDAGSFILSGKMDKSKLEPFTEGVSRHFKKNMLRLPYSLKRIKKAGREFERFFDKYDVLVTPVLSHTTPKIGYLSPELSYGEVKKRVVELAPFTALQNITGSPAISLPMGTSTQGLPIGLQYSAGLGHDKMLLELAYELEAEQPWKFIYQNKEVAQAL